MEIHYYVRMKIGLALGGGGARGFAHIGVLEALEENGLAPNIVAGVSAGAVVGGLYCLAGSARHLAEKARTLIESQEFKDLGLRRFSDVEESLLRKLRAEILEKLFVGSLLFRRAHLKIQAADQVFQRIFEGKAFKDCRIPFVCNALDIRSGEDIVFNQGPMWSAVRASSAIPGIFPPHVEGEMILVDGGAVDNIPVGPLVQCSAGIIIAVHLGSLPRPSEPPRTGAQISQRVLQIMKHHLDRRVRQGADLCLFPDVNDVHWADFRSADLLIAKGRQAVQENLQRLAILSSPLGRFRKTLKLNLERLFRP